MTTPIRVLIVDDHAIVREGLRTLLAEEAEISVVGEASNATEAMTLAGALQPHVILMDLVLRGQAEGPEGIEVTQRIRTAYPGCQVLVLTSFGEETHIRDAIQAGAIGYLLKDVLKPDLLRAIQAAARGEPALHPEAQRVLMRPSTPTTSPFQELTAREIDVLRLLTQGQSNREIAQTLFLTEGTVKGYVSTILGKLQVADRTQAALYAVKHGLNAHQS